MRKILFFAFVATAIIALFSCKKKSNDPSPEQLQQQADDAYNNASSAERTRRYKYKAYISPLSALNDILFKGNIKTILAYDSLKNYRTYQSFNQAGYLTVDSSYTGHGAGRLIPSYVSEITYDNNNFVVLIKGKSFDNGVINVIDSTLYTVKDAENIVVESWKWSVFSGSIWIGDYKDALTYAGKGKIATDTSFSWNSTTQKWEYDQVIVNTYQNGNITNTTISPVTAAVTVGKPDYQYTYEYDAQGNPKVIRAWSNDGTKLVVVNTNYYEITYW